MTVCSNFFVSFLLTNWLAGNEFTMGHNMLTGLKFYEKFFEKYEDTGKT